MQNDLGVNALVSGLVMMPSGIAMGILNPVAGKMYDRIGGRPLALLGFAIITSAAVLLVTIMNTHTAAAMRTGVPEAAASAIGVRASFRTVAIVCAVCLVASLFIRDRGRRLGQQRSANPSPIAGLLDQRAQSTGLARGFHIFPVETGVFGPPVEKPHQTGKVRFISGFPE